MSPPDAARPASGGETEHGPKQDSPASPAASSAAGQGSRPRIAAPRPAEPDRPPTLTHDLLGQPVQPMPDLSADEYNALRADIEQRGVLVPVTVDQHGRILDGHNRSRIAADLDIQCPQVLQNVQDDDEAMDLAVTLNCARRHLTREQQRTVIVAEAKRRPDDSDRAIARRVGCSPSTVGAVRRPVSNLDTTPRVSREEAEASTERVRQHIRDSRVFALKACSEGGATNLVMGVQRAVAQAVEDMQGQSSDVRDAVMVLVWDWADSLTDLALDHEFVGALVRWQPTHEQLLLLENELWLSMETQ